MNSLHELGARYQAAFAPYFERAVRDMEAYAASLSPSLRKALQGFSPRIRTGQIPGSLKPHSLWIAQFFGITDPEIVARAFQASLLMELHCCLQDRRIDRELRNGMDFVTSDSLSNILLSDSLMRFEDLAGNLAFRAHVRAAFCDLGEAYTAEASGDLPYLNPEKMFKAVVDRAAPFHILIAAMGYHSGRVERIAACSTMTCHLILWFQILDDATDWREDLARGRRSYLLHRLDPFMQGQPFEQWQPAGVADALYLFGGAESLLKESVEQLEIALGIARENAAEPALADTDDSLDRWLSVFIDEHREARRWSIERKREFLRACAAV